MAEPLNHLKKDYRARFCYGAGKQQITIQPGQNVLKIIHDCFENCASDSTLNSPSITHCSTPVILNQKEDNLLLNRELNSGLFNSVKKTFNYTSSSVASPVKSISSSGQSPEAHQKSKALDDIVSSNKKEGHEFKEDTSLSEDDLFDAGDPLGSNKKANSISQDVERSSQSPSGISDDENNYEIIGSPVLLVEEAETSVHLSNLNEQATPAMMKRPMEAQRSEGPQARTEEQRVPVERTKCDTVPSEQKKKSLSSAFLVAMTTGTIEKRYSASVAPPPSPVKDLDLGMENECEFLIDESDSFSSTPWFSIPKRNKKIEKRALAKPVPKSQPSERKKAIVQESTKRKDRKAQNEVAVKLTRVEQSTVKTCNVAEERQDELQNASDTNIGLSAKKEDAVKSLRQSGPHVEDSKKHKHGQKSIGTTNEKKSMALKQIPRIFTLPLSKSDTDMSDTEYKPTEIPNEESFESCSIDEQPEDKVASSKEDHNFPKSSQSILKTALCSSHKKQTDKQKLSKVTSAKKLAENRRNKVKKSALKSNSRKSRVQISEESSENESIEEEDERELLKSNKVTSALQKSLKSPKPKNIIHSLSKSDTDTSDTEYKPTEIPNEESFGSCNIDEQPEDKVASSKEDHNFPKSSQSILKTAVCSSHKKQTAKQKLSKVTSSKKLAENRRNKVKKSALKSNSRKSRVQISEESSESESIEEEDERELLKSNKVTSSLQKSLKSPKPKNVIYSIESSGNIYTKTPIKSKEPSQNCIDNIQDVGEGKRSSAKSSWKTATRINQRTNMIVCSNPENAEPGNTTDHTDSSGQDMAEQKHKKSNASVKIKYKKKSNVHQSQVFSAPEENKNHSSGPILKRSIKFTSKNDKPIEYEWEDSSSDVSPFKTTDLRDFLSKTPLKHKLVMPTHTPNVRRTKRIRLKPLEYWRGERVNYMTRPSGGFVVGGIVSPKKDPRRKPRNKRKHTPKTRNHLVEHLNVSLADASKPTAVWDPTINEEVLLECVNTGGGHACFFNDESVEIYKNLNTSAFAAGKLILKPLKEKGHQFVHTDKITFYVIHGKIIVTLHKTSYYLTTGDFFYVPAGNGYNIRNLLNEESVLLFTQLKGGRPIVEDSLNESSSP
ncbi:centromere protein C isoform X2 [Emydura macquarii macquarii]|uniref:centromere protein C isoform X2 n=1 Tax=Emydura macquarii macquarii TaxID=1129001 RepID=UPI00352B7931